ncbi:MAG TPA: HesA/MoeB/ThiF family protein [Telluria sp.]|nr:HesA/MoeB/ThiF family protein [Telluria sp.]
MDTRIPEAAYYGRHFRLPGFTEATQDRLRQARVLVVGLGGLGCPASQYLAGAGVGNLILCDGDEVSATNLHRQVLFDVDDVGRNKAEAAAARLRRHNPHIRIDAVASFADEHALRPLLADVGAVLDGTDNFSAKFAINDACAAAGVPLVYGSIFQFEGQVSVFHHGDAQVRRSYRDLFPEPPPPNLAQNCGVAGVIGVLPGVVGTLQAAEVIKLLTGLGEPLAGKLLVYDALCGQFDTLKIARRARPAAAPAPVDQISFAELQARLASSAPPTLIDVRERAERAETSLGGLHIPLLQLPSRLDAVPADRDIVLYCSVGERSAKAALYLRSALPQARVFNLQGGIDPHVIPDD